MAYTLTLPTLKLPSGNLVATFYANTTTTSSLTLTHSYIIEMGNLTQEVEVSGANLILNSVNMSLWDKDGKFRYSVVQDLRNGYPVKVVLTLSGTTVFIGAIDKYSLKTEQRYITLTNDVINYAISADDTQLPVEVLSFTVKDIFSLLRDVSIKSLVESLTNNLALNNIWTSNNGIITTVGGYSSYLIPIKQILREAFEISTISDIIKVGVQVENNFVSAMSHDYSDKNTFYHWGTGTNLNNVAIDLATGLSDIYVLYNQSSASGIGNLFRSAGRTLENESTPPPESIYNLSNCLDLIGKIAYTFGLVVQPDYSKKSIFSSTITSGGSGYTYNVVYNSNLSGGSYGGEINYIDSDSDAVLDTAIVTSNGSGYTTAPTIIINAPNSANGATATATVSSTLTTVSYTSLSGGSTYSSTPNVYISPPPVKRAAVLEAVRSGGSISSITVVDGGSGYRSDQVPYINIGKPQTQGTTATISSGDITILHGQVYAVTVTSGGSGYTAQPETYVESPPDPIQATATATRSGGIVIFLTITNSGSGYSSLTVPTITIDPPTVTGRATATCTLSDFDVYFRNRQTPNEQLSIGSDILESSIEDSIDSTIDSFEISTVGYTQDVTDTTNLDLVYPPVAKHSNSTCFGLQNSNSVAYQSYTENHLIIKAQYEKDSTVDAIGNNLFSIARFIHSGINLFTNSTLTTSNSWTLGATATLTSSGGAVNNYGFFEITNNTTLSTNHIIGNLNRAVKGEPLVFCAWLKIPTIPATIETRSLFVQALDSSGNIIATKNPLNRAYIDLIPAGFPSLIDGDWRFASIPLEALDINASISKVKIFFSTYTAFSNSYITNNNQSGLISYPQIFVGAETMSRWLVGKYYKYFGKPTRTLIRKYNGLVSTNIQIGNSIVDNEEVYYIKKVSKDLVNNETEIEAINYST